MLLEQIKEEFGIVENTPETIRERLRQQQSLIHPDRNEGKFVSDADANLFHRLADAIEFIDNRNDRGALVSVQVVTDLAKAVTDLVKAQSPPPSNILYDQIRDDISSYHSRFKFPKIALSTITAALSAVWIFPNIIKDHPILSKWLDPSSTAFAAIWFAALLITVDFWVLLWWKEERQREFQESLKTEMVQNRIFRDFLHEYGANSFALEDLVDFLTERCFRHFRSPSSILLGNPREISISTAHTVAELIIKRALSRQAIRKESVGQISETYRIMPEKENG
jgi:hypothetical protein